MLSRWLAVVRERRWRWFAAHQAAVVAVVAGWLLKGNRIGAALNATWLVVAGAWFAAGGRRGGRPRRFRER